MELTEARKRLCHSIFITAMEGGINYWATVTNYQWSRANIQENTTTYAACDINNFHADIFETDSAEEDENGNFVCDKHRVDLSVIDRGINALATATATSGGKRLSASGRLYITCCALNGALANDVDFDAEIADAIVQAGLFNDVVYG